MVPFPFSFSMTDSLLLTKKKEKKKGSKNIEFGLL